MPRGKALQRTTRRWQGSDPPQDRAALEATFGTVWDTRQLAREFVLLGYAGTLRVRRKADGLTGTLAVQSGPPRLYFDFRADPPGGTPDQPPGRPRAH